MEKKNAPSQVSIRTRVIAAAVWTLLLLTSIVFIVKYSVELTRLVSTPSAAVPHTGAVRIGVGNWPGYYPIVTAQKLGLFKKYGVDVELVEAKTAAELNDWIRTGRTHVTAGILADFIVLRNLGVPINMMLATDHSLADVIVARRGIHKPADLSGQRIGIAELNSYAEYFVVRSLELAGVNPRTVHFRTVAVDRVPAAILAGEIDAGHTWNSALSEGLPRGLRTVLSSSENPRLIIDGIAFREEISLDEDIPVAISRAFFEALELQKTDPVAFAAIPAAYFGITNEQAQKFIDHDVDFIGLEENIRLYENDGPLRKEARAITAFFSERGMNSNPSDLAKLIDDTVIRRLENERAMGADKIPHKQKSRDEVSWRSAK